MSATFKNFAVTKIASAVTASATSINVEDASKLPEANGVDKHFYLVLQKATDTTHIEIVKVTNKAANVLTVVRSQEGTIARVFSLGDLAEARLTSAGLLEAFVSVDSVENNAMSQAEFDARRDAMKELYAASGYVHFGKHALQLPLIDRVNEGLWTYTSVGFENVLALGRAQSYAKTGNSKTESPVLNVAGVVFDLSSHINGETIIKFPPAPDGTVTYDSATGAVVQHADAATAFAAETDTNKVVTDRVDMWGFEPFLEEVNATNPFAYPNGLIQSQATTMDGVPTTASNRPVTYYAAYDGDTTSKGKGVNFFSLSQDDKKKVLSNPKNNLVFAPGVGLCQWRLRQRTVASAGNGDWGVRGVIEANLPESSVLSFHKSMADGFVAAQGVNNSAPPYGASTNAIYYAEKHASGWNKETGVFKAGIANGATTAGVNGECYFLVGGTVSRLNQGAYHPSFNPMGTAKVLNSSKDLKFWHNTDVPVASTPSCFDFYSATNNPNGLVPSGSIGGGISANQPGRPDGRFFDAIYADGQGGVCRDMRYSANGLTPVDFDEADLRVKNGTYRGFEGRIFTGIIALSAISTYSASSNQIRVNKSDLDLFNFKLPNGTYRASGALTVDGVQAGVESILVNDTQVHFDCDTDAVNNNGGRPVSNIVCGYELPSSIGGSFLQTDVIGDPANILQTDALKDGWEGSWIPVISDGTTKPFPLTRKVYSGGTSGVYTPDNGLSWIAHTGYGFDSVKNEWKAGLGSGYVFTCNYRAFAKQTEPANNEAVYCGKTGVGSVRASSFNGAIDGCLLGESLLGNVGKSANFSTVGPDSYTHEIQGLALNVQTGKLVGVNKVSSVHTGLALAAPQNNSRAFKALDYNVNINQQGFKQYAATELKHDGTDWGDDGKVTIVDGESTKQDANGNTVKVATHRLKEPIGWIRNKV